jgi:predicted alpha/beta superfamily hydrolase
MSKNLSRRLAATSCALVLGAASSAVLASTVRVHYDTGFGNRITVRGSAAPLSWTSGANATWTTGNIWTYSWPDSAGDVDIKPLVNDATWSTGANYRVKAGTTLDIYPFFSPATGTVTTLGSIYSPQLNNNRSLRIYLPPSYYKNSAKRYPVLYMHDGQNLFSASTAFGGVEWGVDETINRLVGTGAMDEVIVVGIDNTSGRISEYTPCCDAQYGGGKIDQYESFIVNTVMPFINQSYRTLPGSNNTALMGSSLGGLASFYIARRNPAVFSKSGGMSSSFWWNNRAVINTVVAAVGKVPGKFYIDAGTNNDGLADTTAMRDAMLADGYVQGADLYYYAAQGASHNETSWAARVELPLKYLFPWGSTVY